MDRGFSVATAETVSGGLFRASTISIHIAHPSCQHIAGPWPSRDSLLVILTQAYTEEEGVHVPSCPPRCLLGAPIPTDCMRETPASGSPASCSIVIGGWQQTTTLQTWETVRGEPGGATNNR